MQATRSISHNIIMGLVCPTVGLLLGIALVHGSLSPTIAGSASKEISQLRDSRIQDEDTIPSRQLASMGIDAVEVTEIVGRVVVLRRETTVPGGDESMSEPECQWMHPAGTRTVYGDDWTTFREKIFRQPEGGDWVEIREAIGLYSTQEKAHHTLQKIHSALRHCTGKAVSAQEDLTGQETREYRGGASQENHVTWTSKQYPPRPMNCAYDTQAIRNALVQVMMCSDSNISTPLTKIAQRVALTVPQ